MAKKTLKITEAQLKKVVETIINEQRSAGVNTGQPANPQLPNPPVAQPPSPPVAPQDVIYSKGPNNTGGEYNKLLENFINTANLKCIYQGDFTFGKKSTLGLYVRFYLSADKKQYVTLFTNARAHVVMLDNAGKKVDKMVTAKCQSEVPEKRHFGAVIEPGKGKDMIGLYDNGTLIYSFDPKNPIKQAAQNKQALPQAKTLEDVETKKGFVYYGMKGEVVSHIQKLINIASGKVDVISVTGVFDKPTRDSLMRIQMDMEIKADGVVGPLTLEKLRQAARYNARLEPSVELPKPDLTPDLTLKTNPANDALKGKDPEIQVAPKQTTQTAKPTPPPTRKEFRQMRRDYRRANKGK